MSDLQRFLHRASARPFAYGRHDCCTVAARWVLLRTEIDVLQGHRYKSLADGRRQLEAAGLKSHVELFEMALPGKTTLSLVAGDIAVLPGRSRIAALGIVQRGGERIWCFGPEGAGSVPLDAAKRGFGVAP